MRQKHVALWLFATSFMLLVMIVLGGVTRLTGSGLSIMEWAPLSGAIPPLGHAEWDRLFALYRAIPQYRLLHAGMGLRGFQSIFWLEWAHRLWGRLIGIVFVVPLVWFAWTGRIGRALVWRLAGLFVLGGLQGGVGWFMVASGFMAGSDSVSAYRLAVHLGLGLALYAAVFWTGLSAWHGAPRPLPYGRATQRLATCTLGLVALTIVAGAFVAGLHAGLTYNSFPLMGGRIVPAGYAALPFPRDWFENIAAVQFDHRVLATLTAVLALVTVAAGWREYVKEGQGFHPWTPAGGSAPRPAYPGGRRTVRGVSSRVCGSGGAAPSRGFGGETPDLPSRTLRLPLAALAGAVLLQYTLGVATLLLVVPVAVAAAHQAGAVLLLSATLVLLHALRGAGCAVAVSAQDEADAAFSAAGATR